MRLPTVPRSTMRWGAAAAVALLLAVTATLRRVQSEQQTQALRVGVASLRDELQRAAVANGTEAPQPNFVQRLASSTPIEPIVRELQRASSDAGVTFSSVASTVRLATMQTLGRDELAVTLRGAYPALKTVLAQTLDRYPDLIVQRLTLHGMAAPRVDVEARVDLLLVSRPSDR